MSNISASRVRYDIPNSIGRAANPLVEDTVAVVLAGGKGTRLQPLTRAVCKPALPFGAGYRSIDFSLSNCVNSGIRRIGVATQHKPEVLLEHLERAWGDVLDERQRFIAPWRAETMAPGSGYRGTADAVYRNLRTIEALDRRLVLILAGDHVYRMDYGPMLQQHCERAASVTIGCVEIPIEQASEFGILTVDRRNRIERFIEKPKTRAEIPSGAGERVLASMGIYVFDTDLLARALRLDALSAASCHDFGHDVLPRFIRDGNAFAWRFRAGDGARPGYWRDIGTIQAYWSAHMDLLGPSPPLRLDAPDWPIPVARAAARPVGSSLIADSATIQGTVQRSIVFDGVEVGRDAELVDSVVLPGARIGSGCRLRGVIVDSGWQVAAGTVIDRSAGGTIPTQRLEPAVLTGGAGATPARDPERALA